MFSAYHLPAMPQRAFMRMYSAHGQTIYFEAKMMLDENAVALKEMGYTFA